MIALEKLIGTQDWVVITYHDRFYEEDYSFQIRFDSFRKVDMSEIDGSSQIEDIELDANLWLLQFEIVSLNKKKYDSDVIKDKIILIDEDGCQFNFVEDEHLCKESNFAKRSNLRKFFYPVLIPKIKAAGALIYQLPDFFETLFVSVEDGKIAEL